ncbi:MAG TPA: hypothetical protein VLX28_17420 [Thermoanaerobaculia bacterium]|nr:hypothetical protein [Thermoanaerobaculia bacterium]
MTPDCERADRNAAVRAAGRSWLRAGAIDEAALKAIEAAVPDDRARLGPVFRVLLFVVTIFAITSGLGFVAMVLQMGRAEALLAAFGFVAGAGLAFATDYQIVQMRRSQGGTEGATSLLAISYLMGAVTWFTLDYFKSRSLEELAVLSLAGALLAAVAAWRWGYFLYAGVATAALLVALACLPFGRLLWIALPLVATPFLLRLSESSSLPPAHRSSFTAALVVALVGLYFAVHLGSWEWQWIEEIGGGARIMRPAQRDVLWWLSVAATALVPLVLLGLGLRGRRYLLLILGAGTAVASLVTLRWYVHLAPLWIVLTASGAALVGLVLGLRRWLDAGPGKERGGFTAEPLFQDLARQRILEMGAAVGSLSPEARNLHEEPKFEGHGGQFGGGGSSAGF